MTKSNARVMAALLRSHGWIMLPLLLLLQETVSSPTGPKQGKDEKMRRSVRRAPKRCLPACSRESTVAVLCMCFFGCFLHVCISFVCRFFKALTMKRPMLLMSGGRFSMEVQSQLSQSRQVEER